MNADSNPVRNPVLVLFLCTGNTCRSPMGEYLMRHAAAQAERAEISAQSAGVSAVDGSPASPQAVSVLAKRGIDLRDFASQALRLDLIHDADLIVCMEQHHVDSVCRRFPHTASKTFLLSQFGPVAMQGMDIPDPVGMPEAEYEQTAVAIESCIDGLLRKLDAVLEVRDKSIAIGADHRGVNLKAALIEALSAHGYRMVDCGTNEETRTDFPIYAIEVGESVGFRETKWGILVCSSGIGMSIAANKVLGVRAALVRDKQEAILSRQHNDANVLVLAAECRPDSRADEVALAWLSTAHLGQRYAARNTMISLYERGYTISDAARTALREFTDSQ